MKKLVICAVFWVFYGTNNAAILAGTGKAILSIVAYIPQFILIYRNKTTKGWSMAGVWVDFIGGGLAVIQITCDYYCSVNSFFFSIFYHFLSEITRKIGFLRFFLINSKFSMTNH